MRRIKEKEYLSPCGRGRRVAAGEGLAEISIAEFKMHHLFLLSVILQYCNIEKPLTRPFGSTSPTRGEVIIFPWNNLKERRGSI